MPVVIPITADLKPIRHLIDEWSQKLQNAEDEIRRLRADLENVRDLNNSLMKELQTYYGE